MNRRNYHHHGILKSGPYLLLWFQLLVEASLYEYLNAMQVLDRLVLETAAVDAFQVQDARADTGFLGGGVGRIPGVRDQLLEITDVERVHEPMLALLLPGGLAVVALAVRPVLELVARRARIRSKRRGLRPDDLRGGLLHRLPKIVVRLHS